MRYRALDQEKRELEAQLSDIDAQIRYLTECLDAGRHRMEAADLPKQLSNLEGWAGFPRRALRVQTARRGRSIRGGYRGRVHVADAEALA